LSIACQRNNIRFIELLLVYGAHFDKVMDQIPKGSWPCVYNPLSRSITLGHMGVVDVLLSLMSNAEYAKSWLSDALYQSFCSGKTHITKLLLDYGATFDYLSSAQPRVPFRYYTSVPLNDMDLLFHYPVLSTAHLFEKPPLLHAAKLQRMTDCSKLLDSGIYIMSTDEQGLTALHASAGNADSRLSALLIRRGADPNARDSFGVTPLMDAVFYGHEEVVYLLLYNGADPNVTISTSRKTRHDQCNGQR
jgi:ankyrin repeat protein